MVIKVKIIGTVNEVTVEVPPSSTLRDVLVQVIQDNVLIGFQSPEDVANFYLIYIDSRVVGLETTIMEDEHVLMIPALEGG